MARRPPSASPPQAAELTLEQMRLGVVKLQRRIDDLKSFDVTIIQERWSGEVKVLGTSIEETLASVFGHNTIQYNRYKPAAKLDNGPVILQLAGPYGNPYSKDRHEAQRYVTAGIKDSISLLEQAVRGLQEEILDRAQESTATASLIEELAPKSFLKVFVVHGHDEGAREAAARFLGQLGIKPIIFNEQANEGRTVIEKVEAHGDVGFAVVLLTPDDVGSVLGGTLAPRARQNVLLELGYFVGRLGRRHVCAFRRGEVEIPSDFGGVVYEPFDDAGAWKQKLGRELEAVGYAIDWNKVMRP